MLWLTVFSLFYLFRNGFSSLSRNTWAYKMKPSTKYDPNVISKTCLLIPEEGPCRANLNMYYFDPKSRECKTFKWGGCQGNGNRFDSEDECQQHCLSQPNAGPKRPRWCSLSFDYGFCFGALDRYYYDHLWKVCKKTLYSGCGGNKNNFYSFEQCESVCRFGYGSIKSASRDRFGNKKVLIINPPNATEKRGRQQETKGSSARYSNVTASTNKKY